MSVAIWYSTSKPVSREVAERLISAAGARDPLVWYEPIRLFAEPPYPAVVEGWSKVAPMSLQTDDGTVVEIPESDWAFMDYRDLERLVHHLAGWSRELGVDWILTAEGEKMGAIKKGKPGRKLRRAVAWSARMGNASRDPERDSAREEELLGKYPFLDPRPLEPPF